MLKMPALTRPAALARLALLSVLMLGAALPAQAQWKWRDPAGKLQFSDLPPPKGTPDQDILQRPANGKYTTVRVLPYGQASASEAPASAAAAASAASAARTSPSKQELARQARDRQVEQEAQTQKAADERRLAEQRRLNCQSAQENVKMLESGMRLRRSNAQGEPEVVDDKQRERELQRSRAVISSDCS